MCSSNQQFLFGGFFLLRSETLQCQNRIQEKHHSLIFDRRLRRSHLTGAHQSNVIRAFGIQLDVPQKQDFSNPDSFSAMIVHVDGMSVAP